MPIKMIGHEGPGPTLSIRALLPEPLHFTTLIHLIELQHRELDFPVLVLDLLGLGVGLLLALLAAAAEAENEVESGLLLDVVVG